MGLGKKYVLPFAGLKPGTHRFEFELGNSFFEAFHTPEIREGELVADLELIRQSTMLVLNFTISGTFRTQCDRCGIPCTLPVNGEHQLVVKLGGDETREEDGEIIALPASESEIDLAPYLNEYVQLSLPVRKVACEVLNDESLCDREMISKLEEFGARDDEGRDERWDKLKSIKIK
ncbi:MAG: DUF177 domain-containing protein [Bacteroidia bacterium]|nr:DUF177 domain-containing protein [Bacteroidia bacterium]